MSKHTKAGRKRSFRANARRGNLPPLRLGRTIKRALAYGFAAFALAI